MQTTEPQVFILIHDRLTAFRRAREEHKTRPDVRLFLSDANCIITNRDPKDLAPRYEEKDFLAVDMKKLGSLYGEESRTTQEFETV